MKCKTCKGKGHLPKKTITVGPFILSDNPTCSDCNATGNTPDKDEGKWKEENE